MWVVGYAVLYHEPQQSHVRSSKNYMTWRVVSARRALHASRPMIAPPGSRPRATARASVNTSQRIFSPRLLVWLAHIIAVRSQPWQPLDKVLEQWAPLAGVPGKANTHERAYEHMLHLRKLQKPGSRFGHIGWHPIQSFKYYWFARQRAVAAAVQGQTPPTTCEIGFGDAGMSAAIFLTATSSPASAELGGDHHVFDCPACGTESSEMMARGWLHPRGVHHRTYSACSAARDFTNITASLIS